MLLISASNGGVETRVSTGNLLPPRPLAVAGCLPFCAWVEYEVPDPEATGEPCDEIDRRLL